MSPGYADMSYNQPSQQSIAKLDETNYTSWKFKMRMVLELQDLWNVVDGSGEIPAQPVDDEGEDGSVIKMEIREYERRARKAYLLIAMALSDQQLVHIRTCKTGKEAWEKLSEVHEAKGLAARLFLRRKFFTLAKSAGESMQQHIVKVTTMAEKLAAIGAPVSDEDTVMSLLCSLPTDFDNLIVSLESRTENLTLDFVSARLLHEEARRAEAQLEPGEETVLVTRTSGVSGRNRRGGNNSWIKCYRCQKRGHIARNCPERQQDTGRDEVRDEQAKQAAVEAVNDDEFVFAAIGQGRPRKDIWLIDSGASSHQSPNREWFDCYRAIPERSVVLGNGRAIKAIGIGKINLKVIQDGVETRGVLCDVLHVPELSCNLLSVGKLAENGVTVKFQSDGCVIETATGKVLGKAERERGVYCLSVMPHHSTETAFVARAGKESIHLWHERLGHLGETALRRLVSAGAVTGIQPLEGNSLKACVGCFKGKQHRVSFEPSKNVRAEDRLALVHTDVCGPIQPTSMGGKNYAVIFLDDYSRKTWVYLLAAKSEVLEALKRFHELVENETGLRIKILRSDNGGEYSSSELLTYLAAKGIRAQTTTPHTPQQNGRAERMNRTLMESARSMLHARDLPRGLWGEALTTAAYIRNRCPAAALRGRTPEEMWTGNVPDISNMRIFGCKAYVHVPKEKRNKLEAKAVECRFIGYCEGTKGWRFYEARTRRLVKSRDAIFLEEASAKISDGDGTKPGTSHSTHLLDTTRCTGALQTKALEPCRTTLLPQLGPLNSPSGGQYMVHPGIDPAPAAWQTTQLTTGPPVLHERLGIDRTIREKQKKPTKN